MSNQCELCRVGARGEQSHIIPAFVYRWLKRTSATGRLRFVPAPNRPVQDGAKQELLCGVCEDALQEWESECASRLFLPYHDGQFTRLEYKSWLAKFCASVSWRALTYLVLHDRTPTDDKLRIACALRAWREFLLGSRPHPGKFEQHLVPVGAIAETTYANLPGNTNRYLMRAVGMGMLGSGSTLAVVSKMCGLVVVGLIGNADRSLWSGTKVHINTGIIEPSVLTVPDSLLSYFNRQAAATFSASAGLPTAQRDSIERIAARDPERVLQSGTLKAMMEDLRMFGPTRSNAHEQG